MKFLKLFCVTLAGLSPHLAHAWGERGHHTICFVATRLVKNPELKEFLSSRGDMMGYLCNIPDTHWRDLDKSLTTVGNPTHYFEPDKYKIALADVPLSYSAAKEFFSKHNKDFAADIGSAWWRADGLRQRAVAFGKESKDPAKNPVDSIEGMVIAMGTMGHFVGDIAQPYHNTDNYDGWDNGHGGIHSYYESESVDALGLDLPLLVFNKAQDPSIFKSQDKRFAKQSEKTLLAFPVVAPMKQLAMLAFIEIEKVEKLDPLKKKSEIKQTEKNKIKVPAEREPAAIGAKKFKDLIVTQQARAAFQLAAFWDAIFEEAGKPNMSVLRYRFPHKPEFIAPSYVD